LEEVVIDEMQANETAADQDENPFASTDVRDSLVERRQLECDCLSHLSEPSLLVRVLIVFVTVLLSRRRPFRSI